MDPAFLSLALDPARILTHRGFDVDPWQRDFLANHNPYVLLNCCRQAGKSTITAVLALHEALFLAGSLAGSLVVILSPGQRQSGELFRKVLDNYNALDRPVPAAQQSQLKLELTNGSRILCLPGREETVRCFSPTDGTAGSAAGRRPQRLSPRANGRGQGWTVGLMEKEHLGGTCLNTECTPTKTMVIGQRVAESQCGRWRWATGYPRFNPRPGSADVLFS